MAHGKTTDGREGMTLIVPGRRCRHKPMQWYEVPWKYMFSAVYVKNRTMNDLKFWWYKVLNLGQDDPILPINDYLLQLDLNDIGIVKGLVYPRGREFFSSEYLSGILTEKDVVYDIGANIGYYAIMDARKAGHVVAVEPIPKNCVNLVRNFELNDLTNYELHQCALGDKNGEETFYVNAASNWSSFIKPTYGKVIAEIKVPVMTLDSLVEKTGREPTFIRMDVEGYEYNVIDGAKKTLERNPDLRLFIEMHPTMDWLNRFEMLTYLRDKGYEIQKLFLEPESWNFRSMNLLNWLGDKFGFPGYGEHTTSYAELDNMLKNKCCPEVFFLRRRSEGEPCTVSHRT